MNQETQADRDGTIERDGYRLTYRLRGSGTPVLVIGSAAYYERVFPEALRFGCRIAFVDHRGFAARREPDAPHPLVGLDTVARDIDALRAEAGFERCVVVGHSGHGFMAADYAARNPDRVAGLALLNLGPDYGPGAMAEAESDWQALDDPARKALFEKNMAALPAAIARAPENRFVEMMLAMGPRSWFDAGYDAARLWRDIPVNLPLIDHLWGTVFRDIDLEPCLSALDCPVWLVAGDFDFLVPPLRTWDRLRPAIRDLHITRFRRSGHTPMLEEADAFAVEFLDWLRRTDAAAAGSRA